MKPPVRRANRVCLLPWKKGSSRRNNRGTNRQDFLVWDEYLTEIEVHTRGEKNWNQTCSLRNIVSSAAWGDYSKKSVKSQIFSVNNGDLNLSLSDGSVRNCDDEQVGRRWAGHVFTTHMTLLRCHYDVGESIELVGGKFLNRPLYYLH